MSRSQAPLTDIKHGRSFPELPLVGLVSAAAWAIGTNWLGDWYYPIRGIGWGDIFFLGWFTFALGNTKRRRMLARMFWSLRAHFMLLFMFVTLLLVSTWVNAYGFGAEWTNILAIVRILYFGAIVIFVSMLVQQHGYLWVLYGFLAGVGLLVLQRFHDTQVSGAIKVAGVILLKDPNVIGNMLGIAVLLCSLGILAGYLKLSLAAAAAFAVASVATFSKGTWLMVLVGLLANIVAWLMLYRRTKQSFRRFIPATVVIAAALVWLVYANAEILIELINYKLFTTLDSATADRRYQFALAAFYAMMDYPVFGLGFGNYEVVEKLYPSIMPEPSENAHNAFLHIGAVAGLPAFGVLLLLFIYPFVPLWRSVSCVFTRGLAAFYTALALLVFTLSGSVQLQLIAQPFFWLFTGIACGWYASLRRNNEIH